MCLTKIQCCVTRLLYILYVQAEENRVWYTIHRKNLCWALDYLQRLLCNRWQWQLLRCAKSDPIEDALILINHTVAGSYVCGLFIHTSFRIGISTGIRWNFKRNWVCSWSQSYQSLCLVCKDVFVSLPMGYAVHVMTSQW